ncbi:hypothetical protein EVAR_78018_1 [Eumeta japonica]|uniref:Uncharacterized protein n=1 Tax=Eumeta variegata TaxID=151549 RepID=A0A4C1SZY6_EUMVA|nr:hypothetical protein EVAR_78018_1 [Eumeta japonica]
MHKQLQTNTKKSSYEAMHKDVSLVPQSGSSSQPNQKTPPAGNAAAAERCRRYRFVLAPRYRRGDDHPLDYFRDLLLISIRFPIPSQEAGNALTTPLGLRVCMGGMAIYCLLSDDHLLPTVCSFSPRITVKSFYYSTAEVIILSPIFLLHIEEPAPPPAARRPPPAAPPPRRPAAPPPRRPGVRWRL